MVIRQICAWILLVSVAACGTDIEPAGTVTHDLSGDWEVFIYPPPGSPRDADTSHWRLAQADGTVTGQRCTYALVCREPDKTGTITGAQFELRWDVVDTAAGTTQTAVCMATLSDDGATFAGTLLFDGVSLQATGARFAPVGP